MNKVTLQSAIDEARRFLERAEALQKVEQSPERKAYFYNPCEQSAVRRASMDLTRKLADLRMGEIKMDKNDADFDTWFNCLVMNLLDEGIEFNDENSVRDDYNNGSNMFDVVDEIKAEYR